MKKFRAILLGGIVACSLSRTIAQSTAETALLFSQVSNGGSARMTGMGGASVSLGGDFTSATSNPAGLGMFNRSEFTISPAYISNNNHATYFGNQMSDSRSNLSIPSLSFAFHNQKNRGRWVSSTFAITLTRMNDFHSNLTYEGRNTHNSIGDYFANNAFGIDPTTFEYDPNTQTLGDNYNTLEGLAYNNYLIDPYQDSPNEPIYYGSLAGISLADPNDTPHSTQRETRTTSGAQNQWSASYGVNIDDKYFFGVGLHLRSIRYESKSTYQESNFSFPNATPQPYDPINTVRVDEELKTTGSGFSGTIGVIVRPTDGIQLGMSYNTPTVYTLRDVYFARIATDWNDYDYYGDNSYLLTDYDYSTADASGYSADLLSDYKLKTPGRLSLGASYFFGKNGFVSGDAEFINYVGAKYTSSTEGISFDVDNNQIKSLYRTGLNVRLGGEYRLKEYRFRGGFGHQTDPLSDNQTGVSRAINRISLGAGIRKEKYYVDVALVRSTGKTPYYPYSVPGDYSPMVTVTNHTTNFMVTVGVPFR